MKVTVDWRNVLAFAIIALLLSMIVWGLNTYAINQIKTANHQSAASAQKAFAACRTDIIALNQGHTSEKQGFLIESQIAEENVQAINYGFHHHLIPHSLHAYYVLVRQRQQNDEERFLGLAKSIQPLQPIC